MIIKLSADQVIQEVKGINKGPFENFGIRFAVPTPGFGHEWKRSIETEELGQQNDPELLRFVLYL